MGSFLEALPSQFYYRKKFESLSLDYCFLEDKVEKLKPKLIDYNENKTVYDQILKAFCFVNFSNKGGECNNQCYNLYYWIGDKLSSFLNDNISFWKGFKIIYDGFRNTSSNNKCNCIFFSDTDKENFKRMKIVHDYCEDHESIKQTLRTNNNVCSYEFQEYLKEAVSTYKKVYSECESNGSPSYCVELKKHVPVCLVEKLEDLTCELKKVSLELEGSGGFNYRSSDGLGSTNDPSTFDSSQIFMSIFFPVVGILFISFMIYKFTPLLSCIRTQLRRKTLLGNNLDGEDTHELEEYGFMHKNLNLQRRHLNVYYHPS
ncbi:PIR protein [Plasmodium malariae]|uniref:PIR protein n=1 Tax=Plasmodium malariae TaxID=5858 RepID=A0A1D3SM28_PLAMA|nr:PIR protein [Plasmodium malariae]SCO92868.1 PIR protein [Plasmodium malariae]